MRCRDLTGILEACLEAYVDGELDERECGELEAHLAECESCCRAVRQQARLKAFVRQRAGVVRAPEHLVSSIGACLDAAEEAGWSEQPGWLEEQASSTSLSFAPTEAGGGERRAFVPDAAARAGSSAWRSVPVFASVAFLVSFVWMASGGFTHDPLIDDAVRKHTRGLPLEVTGPAESLQRWLGDKVDFRPEVLVFPSGLEPLGARISHIRDNPAVYVGYGRPGSGPDGVRRASLFVFCDPSFDPMAERRRHRRVGERNMVVTNRNGLNVVLWKENEVVYSLVSDLDERELFALIRAAEGR